MKDDRNFLIWCTVIMVMVIGMIVLVFTTSRKSWTFVGLPDGAHCALYTTGGVRKCVKAGDGVYSCVEDWREHTSYCARDYAIGGAP